MAAIRWLALFCLVATTLSQEDDKNIETRAIDSGDNQNSDGKFKIYVGTIDGVRREIFNEVDGGDDVVSSVQEQVNPSDPFNAYDDNNIISTENEKNLFVPKPYRPDKKEEKTTAAPTTTRPPTIRTLPPTLPPTRPPQPIAPIQPQQPFRPVLPQTLPTAPPRVVTQAPFIPQQQFTQPPFQPQPQPQFTRPPFIPQPQPTPVPFRPQPLPQPQPQPQPQQFRPQPQPQPFRPIQPTFNRQPNQFTRPVPLQPPTPAPTTPAPQLPFANTQNLRTGVCPASIFYISTPITGPTRLSFTHFAIAVTVDQCARTCHEFNCAIAHYNPVNGHCEFNPSTAFAIRNGQCPAWPSLHYRNNVVASEPVRIFCVQCQRPRRRGNRLRNGLGRNRAFDQRRGRQRNGVRQGKRSLEHPIIHGMLVSQPRAVALGVTQQHFLSAIQPMSQGSLGSIAVNVSPVETEESNDSPSLEQNSRRKAQGVTQFNRENQLSALKELDNLHI